MGLRVRRPFRPGLILALLTLVGAVVRVGGLTAQSFWLDEYLWTQNSTGSVGDIFRLADGYPPLFGIIVHGMMQAGLGSDWWLRLPSAIAGVLTVPLTYAVARRVGGRAPALAATALMAVNPMAVWYSQECGAYALFMLVALASTWCFLRLLGGGARGAAWGYAVTVCLGFGLHYYFTFVVAAQGLVALWDVARHPERRRLWLAMGVAAIMGFLVWGQAFLYDVASQSAEDSQRATSILALPYTVLTFVGGFSLGPPLRQLHHAVYSEGPLWSVLAPYSTITVCAVGVTAVLALIACGRRLTPTRLLTALLVLAPVLGAWAASLALVGYRPRYAVAALPLAAIWCASALGTRLRPVAGVLLIGLASLQLLALRQIDDADYAREDTRGAAAYVGAHDPAATVVLVGDAADAFERYAGSARTVAIMPNEANDPDRLRERVDSVLKDRHEVWLLSARPWTTDRHDHVRSLLETRFAAREELHFAGVSLRRYVDAPIVAVREDTSPARP
ncbi:MAG TPA: glycosyltransferase family 39 protein [Candidatus Binatia bacterium]|jgi:uncharacterized membrane protein